MFTLIKELEGEVIRFAKVFENLSKVQYQFFCESGKVVIIIAEAGMDYDGERLSLDTEMIVTTPTKEGGE
jgi:hypothetical protein